MVHIGQVYAEIRNERFIQLHVITRKSTVPNCWYTSNDREFDEYALSTFVLISGRGMKTTHAYFSAKAAELHDSFLMFLAAPAIPGTSRRVTSIGDINQLYLWDDKVYVGEVIECTQHERISPQICKKDFSQIYKISRHYYS